jgi:hypothetical protein
MALPGRARGSHFSVERPNYRTGPKEVGGVPGEKRDAFDEIRKRRDLVTPMTAYLPGEKTKAVGNSTPIRVSCLDSVDVNELMNAQSSITMEVTPVRVSQDNLFGTPVQKH